jgi:hypothetical protein
MAVNYFPRPARPAPLSLTFRLDQLGAKTVQLLKLDVQAMLSRAIANKHYTVAAGLAAASRDIESELLRRQRERLPERPTGAPSRRLVEGLAAYRASRWQRRPSR